MVCSASLTKWPQTQHQWTSIFVHSFASSGHLQARTGSCHLKIALQLKLDAPGRTQLVSGLDLHLSGDPGASSPGTQLQIMAKHHHSTTSSITIQHTQGVDSAGTTAPLKLKEVLLCGAGLCTAEFPHGQWAQPVFAVDQPGGKSLPLT